MKRALLLLVVLVGCSSEPELDARALRQAAGDMVGLPIEEGQAGDETGTSVAGCPGFSGGFVVGSPGVNKVTYHPPASANWQTFQPAGATRAGTWALCGHDGNLTSRETFSASPTAYFINTAMTTESVLLPVSAVAQSELIGGPMLIAAETLGQLDRRDVIGPAFQAWTGAGMGVGHSLAFLPSSATDIALTVSSPPEVKTFFFNGATPTLRWVHDLGLAPGAVAYGNFHPTVGNEVAVTQGNEVFIYSTTLGGRSEPALMVLSAFNLTTGSAGQFGLSLATEPTNAGGGLNALWVGSPGEARVYRFLGLTADIYEGPQGSSFGHAIGFPRRTQAIVGAPRAAGMGANSGAAYLIDFDGGSFHSGDLQVESVCVVGRACTVDTGNNCFVGTCVGGVLCDVSFGLGRCDGGTALDGGIADGGVVAMDASVGVVDAGVGVIDAGVGVVDAGVGVVDAGVGVIDAGVGIVDAGVGVIDAGIGVIDGGVIIRDAGVVDGGFTDGGLTDAGVDPSSLPTDFAAGCTCQTGSLAPVWLFAIAWLRRRRR